MPTSCWQTMQQSSSSITRCPTSWDPKPHLGHWNKLRTSVPTIGLSQAVCPDAAGAPSRGRLPPPARRTRMPTMADRRHVEIQVTPSLAVSGLLLVPAEATCLYVLAHGAGAGMRHPFITAVAEGLASRGIATLRYQFPYMERGIRRPDPPQLAQATVRVAVEAVRNTLPGMPLLAGGKSFGGRMTSQAQAAAPLPSVVGLPFLAFPLHPIGKPTGERAVHLSAVSIPMLFVQGTRDGLTDSALLATVLERLGRRTTLVQVREGDHSFHVPARSGRTDRQALGEALDGFAAWVQATVVYL